MENLLRNDYTAYYGVLKPITITEIYQETNEPYFEIEDDTQRETQITTVENSGTAAYNNRANLYLIGVINYDKFVTSLPHNIQRGRERCDLIVYTKNINRYFLLNELKTNEKRSTQLKKSLVDLLAVPSIAEYANTFAIKRCCFFNKRTPMAPVIINAVTAFNQLNTITQNGLKIIHPEIERLGFEYYKYYDGHQFVLS